MILPYKLVFSELLFDLGRSVMQNLNRTGPSCKNAKKCPLKAAASLLPETNRMRKNRKKLLLYSRAYFEPKCVPLSTCWQRDACAGKNRDPAWFWRLDRKFAILRFNRLKLRALFTLVSGRSNCCRGLGCVVNNRKFSNYLQYNCLLLVAAVSQRIVNQP